jgi:peptidoglycan/xylan/chitin deacetylase (PgdA/CDA1 family)
MIGGLCMINRLLGFVLCLGLLLNGCSSVDTDSDGGVAPAVTVLMYHHFAEGEETSVTVDPERFREQLVVMKEAGYQTIEERDLVGFLGGTNSVELPDQPLVITIDDGYLSNYEIAYPILAELEMHATIYVIVNSRGKTPGYIPHFDWDEAREMVASPWIDIQSHTFDHHHTVVMKNGKESPALAAKMIVDGGEETDEDYRERIWNDLKLSKEVIEAELGNEVFALTYPYGAYNDTVVEVAKELGFGLMYTVKPGRIRASDSPVKLNRINADGRFSGEDLLREVEKYK